MDRFEKIFDYLLKVEGVYSDDKNDRGGKTKYGIIEEEARRYGYKGHMRDMPLSIARDIYNKKYYHRNGLDTLKSDKIALSVCDFVVNAGDWGAKKAQAALNELGFDLKVDGILGVKSLDALNKVDENKFLKNWEIPIINDFLVMVWFGLSKKMAEKYIKEDFEKAHNTLIAQEGNSMISVEPSRYIKKMSQMIKDDKSLQNEVKNIINENRKSPADIVKLTQNAEFNSTLNEYMEKFGDRTVHELKLEAFTLREEPMFLIKMIYSLAMAEDVQEHSKRNILEEQKKIYSSLKINPLKKYILKKSVFYAKKFIRLRENLRYERTKVFGMVRKIMKKMGEHLKESCLIDNERDIFYLTVDEIFGLVDGSIIDIDLKNLIKLRKEEYRKYETSAILPDRFLTRGFLGENFEYEDLTGNSQLDENTLKGTGCSKGIVKGKVKIVLNPMSTEVEEGDIVVTKSTDPSWVMVFPLLKGLIVEKGSLLSHSAIISREMNIPAIVGVQGATSILKTGDMVQFDGSTGIIKKLNG